MGVAKGSGSSSISPSPQTVNLPWQWLEWVWIWVSCKYTKSRDSEKTCVMYQHQRFQFTHVYWWVFCLFVCLFVCFGRAVTCGTLVPHPGIEPVPCVLRVQSLNHCTTREVLSHSFFLNICRVILYSDCAMNILLAKNLFWKSLF